MEKQEKTIHEKMSLIKKILSETKINKSGHNKFAGFHYHELSDFMQVINKLNEEYGVNDFVEINQAEQICKITLINTKDSKDFYSVQVPYKEAEMLGKGGAPSNVDAIQRMGSTITYNRRYLYMTAYNIQESDGIDGNEPVDKKVSVPQASAKATTPATQKQKPIFTVENFKGAYEKGSKLDDIRLKASVTPEIEQAYIDYVIENDKLKA